MTSSQQKPYDERFSALQYPYATFGILGSFPGDADLERELEWCRQAFRPSSNQKPPLVRLVDLLGALPLKGRQAVVRHIIAPSPHRDAILWDLFDYCFQPDDEEMTTEDATASSSSSSDVVDEEFVVIANPSAAADDPPKPLNLNRYHIFQVVIVLMALSGPAGAEASRRYLQSASTRYRAKILVQCVTSLKDFTDQDLWQAYCSSPDAVKHKVIDACKQSGRRKAFLRRVYEEDSSSTSLIFWLESDYLAGNLDKLMKDDMCLTMKQWGTHGEVYIDYCRKKMEECGKDGLKRGATWQALQSRMELNSMRSSHVYALLELLETCKAYKVCYSVSQDAREYLDDLSAKGNDVSVFADVTQVRLDKMILNKLTKQERLELVLKTIENRDWDAFSSLRQLVPLHKLPYKDIHAKATSDDLWALLAGQSVDAFFRCFSGRELATAASTCHEMMGILRSWADLHLQFKPSDLSAEQVSKYCHGKSESERWRMWYKSYVDTWDASRVACVIAEESKSPVPLSSRLTIYAQHAQELLDIAIRGLKAASTHLGTDVALDPVLPLLEKCSIDALSQSNNTELQSFVQQAVKVSETREHAIIFADDI